MLFRSEEKKAGLTRRKLKAKRNEVVDLGDECYKEDDSNLTWDMGELRLPGGTEVLESWWNPGNDPLLRMPEGGTAISKTPMGVNYIVDELTTIRSDGESHKVLVATVPFEATISHITTPRKSPLAYLQVCFPPAYPSSYLPSHLI